MKKSFADLNEMIFYSCYVVDLHYGTYGTINAGQKCFSSSIFDPELHDCITETFSVKELGVIACRGFNLKEIEYYKNGKKALELINAYKFDKMTQSECGKSCGNWVEAFFRNLSSPSLSTKLENCIKTILKLALNQVKPFVIESEKYSTTLLYKSIGDKSTRCHFKKKFAAENHEKTLKDYGVKNVSDDWSQFHTLELMRHSTPSFLFDKMDFFESWWDPKVLFEKRS